MAISMARICLIVCLLCSASMSYSQLPPGTPLHVDLGVGGGSSMPIGTLSDKDNAGYHLGGRVRLSGFLLLNVIADASFHHLQNKAGNDADLIGMAGVGLEYPIPFVVVKPYFVAEASYNSIGNTGSGRPHYTRFGANLGAGVLFGIPAFGDLDASVRYQLLNLAGKDPNEDALTQVSANFSLMFRVF